MKYRFSTLAVILATISLDAVPASGAQRPNVLLLLIDDMGYGDLSCFGNTKVATPSIDRLAAGGLRLTHFYSNSPICSPSRVALSTGQYPPRWRIHSFLDTRKHNSARKMADYLDLRAIHTARVFKDAGYRTAHFGKWHMGGGRDVGDAPLPTKYDFDETMVALKGSETASSFPNRASPRPARNSAAGGSSPAPPSAR